MTAKQLREAFEETFKEFLGDDRVRFGMDGLQEFTDLFLKKCISKHLKIKEEENHERSIS